ncbi:ATPase inhibitor subunit zeta [Rhizobium leguminosarum]|uniref:ATPase inhibitor subunit zeta n=1 Tax=Rhizobium leguminosarum TaxID=384 RepID=UPI001AE49AEF
MLRRNDSRAYLQELNDTTIGTPTDDDLVGKLLRDFELAGIKISKDDLARRMHEIMFEAAEELDSGRT